MIVTVAICSWNRCKLLDQTLAQMRKLTIPSGVEWEVLVVNNNCTDDTDQVLARYQRELPLRRIFEPKPGQCNARNAAIAQAAGELMLWTDDDVLVEQDWLKEYVQAASAFSESAFFGGRITPWFDGTPPKWLRDHWRRVSGVFATREIDADAAEVHPSSLPFGANFAVRTAIQRRYLYDPKIGLRPGSNLRGDETTVLKQILSDGHPGRWVPGAVVRHFIPNHRQTVKYIRGFHFGQGQHLAMTIGPVGGPSLLGKPRWLLRAAIEAELKYQLRRFFVPPDRWLTDAINAAMLWGQLSESRIAPAPNL